MNEAFWLVWKALTPVLAVAVVALLIDRRQQERRADGLEQELANLNQRRNDLERKLHHIETDGYDFLLERNNRLEAALAESRIKNKELSAELAETQTLANILRHRDEATCPCSAVKADRERIAYLTERNNQLMFDALSNNAGKYIKINRN